MRKFIIAILALVSSISQATSLCDSTSDALSAHYSVTVSKHGHETPTTELTLWRQNNTVAHQYSQTNISEMWTLVRGSHIKPVRFFDEHKRGIEYQPGESIHGRVEKDFSYRYQLISDTLLSEMTLVKEEGAACSKKQTMKHTLNGVELALVWLPEQKLIESFTVTQGEEIRHWSLEEVSFDKQAISAFFATRNAYQLTDYADIGDDHTDPFLTNMVNMGFIEAGASGFYDTEGRAIEGHGHGH